MNDLRRELAPVTGAAWREIDDQAKRSLEDRLAARKLVDFRGPLGWAHPAEPTGRTARPSEGPLNGVELRVRYVQPMVELRVPFELSRDELDAVDRGAADPDLAPLEEAAAHLARAEDDVVFHGLPVAAVRGIVSSSPHRPLAVRDQADVYPRVIAEAIEALREAGVSGPYAMALGPRCYTYLARTTGPGGYPVLRHVRQQLIDGPVVWAPALDGALVLSLRGGDFELVSGRDIAIGYDSHTRERVRLYLEESLTFRLLTPEAAVPLRYEETRA
ncbi:MAG: bacteriocin family protein [Planctomycetes bacterium]|nr:bacteriocin family protein [Planctomycetota bacterium]